MALALAILQRHPLLRVPYAMISANCLEVQTAFYDWSDIKHMFTETFEIADNLTELQLVGIPIRCVDRVTRQMSQSGTVTSADGVSCVGVIVWCLIK